METINEMLEEEIKKTLEELKSLDATSEAAKQAMTKLEKYHAERIRELEADLKRTQASDSYFLKSEENKLRRAELEQRAKQAEDELRVKEAELDEAKEELRETKRTRRWRTVMDILGITIPVGVSSYWMYKGLRFEEEGKIYSSRTGQWLSSHLRLFGKKG